MTAYATLVQVEAAISDNSLDVTYPAVPPKAETNLSRLIDAATNTIDRYVSRTRKRTFYASGDTTRTFNVLDNVIGTVLYLNADMCSVTTVANDGTPTTAYKALAFPPHDSTYTAIKLLTGAWAYSVSIYPDDAASITGKFAYSATPPDAVVQACIQLTVSTWRQRNTVANISTTMISPDGTLVLPDGLPKSVVDLLEPYVV